MFVSVIMPVIVIAIGSMYVVVAMIMMMSVVMSMIMIVIMVAVGAMLVEIFPKIVSKNQQENTSWIAWLGGRAS